MTKKSVVIVVLNDSNNNHKQSHFFVDFLRVNIPVERDPSVCKSDWLHVDISGFPFVELGYVL